MDDDCAGLQIRAIFFPDPVLAFAKELPDPDPDLENGLN
jgi:hypothetical protein